MNEPFLRNKAHCARGVRDNADHVDQCRPPHTCACACMYTRTCASPHAIHAHTILAHTCYTCTYTIHAHTCYIYMHTQKTFSCTYYACYTYYVCTHMIHAHTHDSCINCTHSPAAPPHTSNGSAAEVFFSVHNLFY